MLATLINRILRQLKHSNVLPTALNIWLNTFLYYLDDYFQKVLHYFYRPITNLISF